MKETDSGIASSIDANILYVAGISVAFPVGAGVVLVLGVMLNYNFLKKIYISTKGVFHRSCLSL